ncbi:MAG: hypothetical protein A3H06_00695 [Candidatus Colwellbacteria bacterium RIFCSPLOWO2_12_FULL_44_13]|uniref:Type 4 fimbrial biogenesis protein PilX N-terminal domain-containing protein n=3 Tax=Candidatus Colwelliibacteriota TaxID=1817904 RepID=A0A1G1Z9F6_9BACT|nr:MAG: hypothetical protein A3F24_01890 [Candidatus Colwellbacteria bacterium RIFCSPHIGHO2_12_FULL_44_17]OGY60500.1 MAG: hypothetical protein A3I31_02730 [Candidatus Colwellbacteria bacterium RIFCSPLOWO2_02_FULL_44_20b]OGY61615.1 MAG: hypothetical protein A3H06_00695 [Candidatus Colwellbacteria bacterium RIFCSPLOWO2_12_FULL_44_13]
MKFLFQQKSQKGIASLPTVLLISGIILELGIASLALSTISSKTSTDAKLSMIALNAAYAGADEALLKITQDKRYPTAASCVLPANTFTLDPDLFTDDVTVAVCVTKDSDTRRTIISTATTQNRQKRVKATLAIDGALNALTGGTGRVQLISFEEVAL